MRALMMSNMAGESSRVAAAARWARGTRWAAPAPRRERGARTRPFAFALLAAAGAALQAAFMLGLPTVTDDGRLYLQLARHWLRTGHYQRLWDGHWIATTARLPGYPIFLAALWRPWGPNHAAPLAAIYLVQAALVLATAALAARLARRVAPAAAAPRARARAEVWSFALVALCPFFAIYAASVLTETAAIFCTTLAVLAAIAADQSLFPRRELACWVACGLALAAGIQIRPDTGLVLLVPAWLLLRNQAKHRGWPRLGRFALIAALALAPLAAWTARNWRAWHVFRPLVTADATEVGEPEFRGFDHWTLTWLADYHGVEDFLDNAPEGPLDPAALPAWAFGAPAQRAETLRLLAAANRGRGLTPSLDAQFAALAAVRLRRHPVRTLVALPLARMTSLWFSPRIEILPFDDHWWPPSEHWNDDPRDFLITLGALGLNAALLALGLWGWAARRLRYAAPLAALIVARTVLLSAYPSCEPRYTLEVLPLVLVWAAWAFAGPAAATGRDRPTGTDPPSAARARAAAGAE